MACHVNKVRRSNIARTARQRRSWLGEWAATKLRLNMTTAPGPGAGVTGKHGSGDIAAGRLPRYAYAGTGKLPIG